MIDNPRPGDHVRCTNETLLRKYPEDLKNKVGEIIAPVEKSDKLVVEFGSNSFIISPKGLVRHTFKEKPEGPVIERILRKWNTEDDKNG